MALLGLAIAGCETTWIDPMEAQKRYDPYEENPFFSDGRAMRPLVEGTIAREQPVGGSVLLEGIEDGRYATRVPLRITPDLMALGRQRYDVTCAPCHGLAGDGNSWVARKMTLRPPPPLIAPPVRDQPPGRIFQSISLGYGLMPPYAAEVPFVERWAVVAYLQALRRAWDASLDDATPEGRHDLEVMP